MIVIIDDEREKEDIYLQSKYPEIKEEKDILFIKNPNEFWKFWKDYLKKQKEILYISFDNDLGINPETKEIYEEGNQILRKLLWEFPEESKKLKGKLKYHTANIAATKIFKSLLDSFF